MTLKQFLLVVAAVLVIGNAMTGRPSGGRALRQLANGDAADVVLLSAEWCGWCDKTRDFLETNAIAYTEYDVEDSTEGQLLYEAYGARGVPVVDVKGTIIHGYDPDAIVTALR